MVFDQVLLNLYSSWVIESKDRYGQLNVQCVTYKNMCCTKHTTTIQPTVFNRLYKVVAKTFLLQKEFNIDNNLTNL